MPSSDKSPKVPNKDKGKVETKVKAGGKETPREGSLSQGRPSPSQHEGPSGSKTLPVQQGHAPRADSPSKRSQGSSQQQGPSWLETVPVGLPRVKRADSPPKQGHRSSQLQMSSSSETVPIRRRHVPKPDPPRTEGQAPSQQQQDDFSFRTNPEQRPTMLKRFERIGPSAASSTTTPPAGRPQRIPDTDMPWPAMILDFQERIDSTNYQMIEEYRTVIGALKNTGRQALGEVAMFEARVEAIERWRGGDRERMRGVRTHNLQHINVRRGVLRKFLSQLGEPRTDNERRMVESVNQELEQYQREEERMTNNPDSYLPGMI